MKGARRRIARRRIANCKDSSTHLSRYGPGRVQKLTSGSTIMNVNAGAESVTFLGLAVKDGNAWILQIGNANSEN